MAINDATLKVDVYTTIRDVLVAAAIKVTNSTTSGTKTASVLAAHNDKRTTVPQIVISPASVSEGEFKFGDLEGKKFINVNLECYYKNTLGADQLDDACVAAIKAALLDATITGMDLNAVDSDYGFANPNEAKFQFKTVSFTFIRE
jgi:hypothetical protein